LLEKRYVKVDEEAGGPATQAQIAQNLRLVNGENALDRLYLDDDFSGDKDVQAISGVNSEPFVLNWNCLLPLIGKFPKRQLLA
jgi:hypothetical protein